MLNGPSPNEWQFQYPVFVYGCGCGIDRKEKTDCYFYREDHDMGATVPYCLYHGGYGNCSCNGCNKYFPSRKAFGIIKMHVDESET